MRYSRGQIVLHWLTVVLVVPQVLLAAGISARFAANREAGAVGFDGPSILHMGLGGLLLLIVLLRLMLRQEDGVPSPDPVTPGWQVALAAWVQRGLYAVLLALPVTGALAWGMGSTALGRAHDMLHLVLIALVAVHVAGALYGQFVRGDGTLARMLPGPGRSGR